MLNVFSGLDVAHLKFSIWSSNIYYDKINSNNWNMLLYGKVPESGLSPEALY